MTRSRTTIAGTARRWWRSRDVGTTFSQLPARLQAAIVARLGWTALRPVQEQAGAAVLAGATALRGGAGLVTIASGDPEVQAQLLAQYPVSGVPPANWTLFIDGRNFNLGTSISRGWDFQASTRVGLGDLGQLSLSANGTVFTKYEVALTPASAMTDQLNTIYNPMRFKARFSAGWNYGPTQTSLTLHHVNAYDNNLTNPVQRVDARTTLDARVAVALGELSGTAMLRDCPT